VDALLDSDISGIKSPYLDDAVCFHSPTTIKNARVTYDKTVLSYKILRGIIVNKNKSLLHFGDILRRTLEEDYKILCKFENLRIDEDDLVRAIELQGRIRNVGVPVELEYSEEMFDMTAEIYDDIMYRTQNPSEDVPVTDMELQQKWCYDCAWMLWGIDVPSIKRDSQKLEQLYHTLIGSCADPRNVSSKYELFYKMKRCREVLNSSSSCEETQDVVKYHMAGMQKKLQGIMEKGIEYNIELYRTRIKSNYVLLAHGHYLLNVLFPENRASRHGSLFMETPPALRVQSALFEERALGFIRDLSGSEYDAIVGAAFSSHRERFGKGHEGRDDVTQSNKKVTGFVAGLLEATFDVSVVSAKDSNDKRTKDYETSKRKEFSCLSLGRIVRDFKPDALRIDESCEDDAFVSDEEYDDIEGTSDPFPDL
jgi:hypothetical protein